MEDGNMEQSSMIFTENDLDHTRSIVHIDIDCFYAQVETLRNPTLKNVPLGIQQKNLVVTSNYEARKYGVKKCMLVQEAMKLCPNLKLVNGEDLHEYRIASNKIFLVIQTFKCPVEKLGLDENFIDVTTLVRERMNSVKHSIALSGKAYSVPLSECPCGCNSRLKIASQIANEIRQKILEVLGMTCCAGIGHNKLLAKLVGALNKPNDQTTIFPQDASSFMCTLPCVGSIPSIGSKTSDALSFIDVKSVSDLQLASIEVLKKSFSSDMAVRLRKLSYGDDDSAVKQSGKPSSIGLEDSFKVVSVQSEVEEKFSALLSRLLVLVREDGRIPTTLRVTLRKKDGQRLSSHRETRQAQISTSIFNLSNGCITVSDNGQNKLMAVIMRLFYKLVNMTKPFHITLLGLAFTKFQERMSGRSSIVNYFMNDISVQSVLSLQNDCDTSVSSMDYTAASPSGSTTTDMSEPEIEPSPKKAKKVNWIAKRRCLAKEDVASPSKLKVSDLRLNSKELEKVSELRLNSRDRELTPAGSPLSDTAIDTVDSKDLMDEARCPSYVDKEVFNSLPDDVQQELKAMWKNSSSETANIQITMNKAKPNTILRYFLPQK